LYILREKSPFNKRFHLPLRLKEYMKEPFWEETYKVMDYKTLGRPSPEIIQLTKTMPENANILDAGCGDGRNSLYFASNGFHVDAFDISSNAINKIRKLAEINNLALSCKECSLQEFHFEKYYDLIISSGVYHFIDKNIAMEFIDKSKKHTKLNGYNFIVVFIDTLPIPEDLKDIAIGLYADHEIKDLYFDWETKFFKSYEFEDDHPGGIHHKHAANKYIGKKLTTASPLQVNK